MTEPIYHYVKGQGWVPAMCKVLTFEKNGLRLICENRVPEIGEKYFWENGFESSANNLSTWGSYTEVVHSATYWKEASKPYMEGQCCVVRVENI
jgi:hypothetical protein